MGKLWRAAGTAFCFILYATVAWLGSVTVLPALVLWPGSRRARQRRVRRLISASFRALLALIALLRLGDVKIRGRQWLAHAEGTLIIANHPMYLDFVALVGALPLAGCVVKGAMWHNPIYRRFVLFTGYVSNASTQGLIDGCVKALRQGEPLVLFPEGTRSVPGQALKFYRGAAQVALRAGCEIIPAVVRCEPRALGKGQSWHHVADRPWRLEITFLPPHSLQQLGVRPGMAHGVAARRITQTLTSLITEHLDTL